MSSIFANLPKVIINKILDYNRVINYRNGKYIDSIPRCDNRYKIIEKVSRPIRIIDSDKYILNLINKRMADWYGYNLTYYFINYTDKDGNKYINYLVTIQSIRRVNDGYDKYYKYGRRNIYSYDTNENVYKTVENAI
jgi:hypothetical protein